MMSNGTNADVDDISPEERRQVEELVRNEVRATNVNGLHPQVEGLSLATQPSVLLQELENFDDDDDDVHIGGIDVERYHHEEYVSTALAYESLHDRNISILEQNAELLRAAQTSHLEELAQLGGQYKEEVERKRGLVDGVNEQRRKRQVVDHQPVEEYLESRWRQGLRLVVAMSAEASRAS